MSAPNIPTRIMMFRDFVPDPGTCISLFVFCRDLSIQRGNLFGIRFADGWVAGVDAGGYYDGRLCLVRGDNGCFPYSFPLEVSFHFPVDFLDGLPGIDCL